MRRVAASIIGITLLAALAVPAAAAPPSASDFAADCNEDGLVEVDGRQRYVGGTGELAGPCTVTLTEGSRLVFKRATITGTSSLTAISSPANTRIRVIDSTITVAGPLELTAGCCAGEGDGSENNGRVIVRRSSLQGSSIQLLASFDDDAGRVVVRDSSLTATGALGIQLRASDLGGTNGVVRVIDSVIDSAGDLTIRSGAEGRTAVRRNAAVFVGEADVSTGVDGVCRSRRNTPELPCVVNESPGGEGGVGEEGEPGEPGVGGGESGGGAENF